MNKFLLFILLFSFTFISKGQEVIDSSETAMLEVQVFDEDSVTPLDSVKISIVGTDGSGRYFFTDSVGFVTIKLKPNTNYSLFIKKYGYMVGRGKESTISENFKDKYVHSYYLSKIITCGVPFPKILFLENNISRIKTNHEEHDSISYLHDILIDNPTIVLELIAVRSKNEPEKISQKRADKIIKELVAEGIEKDRLIFKDGGIGENEKEEDNRYVVFKVIKTDYVSKGSKK
ncbi:MAG: hypothetical protein RQ875_12045 [Vicingaceae bacterium]|nr:hypothetical protein [Vicingaceae bacterium]